MRKFLFALTLVVAPIVLAKTSPAPAAPVAAVLKSTPAHGEVSFEAVGKPSMLKIKGVGEGPEGEVALTPQVHGDFKFKLASLKTGVDMRDDHMKTKYLQIDKFPTAELKIDAVEGFKPEAPEASGLSFKGTLTIHGVTTPVAGTVDFKKKEKGYAVKADFETKVTDHAIDVPSYLGVTVADAVKVSVETDLM